MNFFQFIFQDWRVNKSNPKGRIVLLLFRIANFCSTRKIYYYIGFIYLIFYRVLVEWFFGIEIPWNVKIGKNLSLFHGQALVMTNQVVIGHNCTLRQSTTIGNKQLENGLYSGSPIIGNYVDIGSNVCIIGLTTINDQVLIGSGAVVVKDVPSNSTVIGNPGISRPRKEPVPYCDINKPRILFSMPSRHHVEIASDEIEGMKELGYPCNKFFYAAKEGVNSKFGRLWVIFQNAHNLIKLARLFKPDIIYFNSRLELLAGVRDFITISLFKIFYHWPVNIIIKSHGSDIDVFETKNLMMNKIVLPFLKKHVSAWLFLSTEERSRIIKHYYLPTEKVFTTKNIVRTKQFHIDDDFKARYKIPSDHKILLFVGRIIKEKGIKDVINAFVKIKDIHRTTLIIVGDGIEMESIKELTRTLGLSKFVVFTGFIPEHDVIPFYANSDILLFPTYFPEGFSMALFNAVAAGMCIVTTHTRAAIDYLSEPENCLWTASENSSELANQVNNLLQSEILTAKMIGNNITKGNLFIKQQVCAELAITIQKITNLQWMQPVIK